MIGQQVLFGTIYYFYMMFQTIPTLRTDAWWLGSPEPECWGPQYKIHRNELTHSVNKNIDLY